MTQSDWRHVSTYLELFNPIFIEVVNTCIQSPCVLCTVYAYMYMYIHALCYIKVQSKLYVHSVQVHVYTCFLPLYIHVNTHVSEFIRVHVLCNLRTYGRVRLVHCMHSPHTLPSYYSLTTLTCLVHKLVRLSVHVHVHYSFSSCLQSLWRRMPDLAVSCTLC